MSNRSQLEGSVENSCLSMRRSREFSQVDKKQSDHRQVEHQMQSCQHGREKLEGGKKTTQQEKAKDGPLGLSDLFLGEAKEKDIYLHVNDKRVLLQVMELDEKSQED